MDVKHAKLSRYVFTCHTCNFLNLIFTLEAICHPEAIKWEAYYLFKGAQSHPQPSHSSYKQNSLI